MRSLRAWLLSTAVLCASTGIAAAEGELSSPPTPPNPTPEQIERALPDLGNPLNKPITGAAENPLVVGTAPPPSLEALQAARPGDESGDGIEPGRAEMIRTAALTYGAQGGLAARSFALNEMLRRYETQLDAAYDFSSLVLPVGRGQTLMRPPVVSAAQMAFALGEGGQVARETSCLYRITRAAQLASAPPNWRVYLVRSWAPPRRPNDGALPHTRQEVAFWNKWVAEGWAQGEKQAVEIFLSDLSRLERDIVGMARYRVLARAHLVEAPRLSFLTQQVTGNRDSLQVGDRTVRITDQPGLQQSARRWTPARGCPQ